MTRLFPLLLIVTLAPSLEAAGLEVSDAWLRQPPPIALPVAGYLTLTNTGTVDVTVTALTSAEFSRIEWHTTEVVDGVASMRRQHPPTLHPGESLTLAPGGRHLMLFDPSRSLAAGDRVPLELTLDDGAVLDISAEVRAPATDHHQHHSMHSHSHTKE